MRWRKRFAVIAVMFAAFYGVASGQAAIGAIIAIAEGVNTVVRAAQNTYRAARYVINATDGVDYEGQFDHIADPDERQQRIEEWRYNNLARHLESLHTELAAAESNIIGEIRHGFRNAQQSDWARRTYGDADVTLIFARQMLRRPPSERTAHLAEARTHAQTLTRRAAEAARMEGDLGPQFVGGLSAATQALRALRAIYTELPDADTSDYLLRATENLENAAARAAAPDSLLNRSAADDRGQYIEALAALSRRHEMRTLVRLRRAEDARLPVSQRDYFFQYDQPARACFEQVIATVRRRCRGNECPPLNPLHQVDVPTRYRQTSFEYRIVRTSIGPDQGPGEPPRSINMLGGLRPENLTPIDVTESSTPAENCPWRSDPAEAWLQTALEYNQGMREIAPIGARAAMALAAVELNAKTRQELARLRESLRR